MTAPVATAAEAESQAERIRRDLAGTLDQLIDNLTPTQLAGEAMAATRAHTPDWLLGYWGLARSPVGMAVIGAAAVSLVGALVARRGRGW